MRTSAVSYQEMRDTRLPNGKFNWSEEELGPIFEKEYTNENIRVDPTVLRDKRPGDQIVIEIKEVTRTNYLGQRETVRNERRDHTFITLFANHNLSVNEVHKVCECTNLMNYN